MVDQIKEIMASVLGIEPDTIDGETSAETVKEWDSLKHMNLVIAFENELDIQFSTEEIAKIMNFEAIVSSISQKLGT